MADYDDVEVGLNKEVDVVIDRFHDQPEAPYEEPMDQQEVAEKISRIAGEIQSVIPLILPKRNIAAATGEPEQQPQDPVLAKAAKDLLMAQIDRLKHLVGRLE